MLKDYQSRLEIEQHLCYNHVVHGASHVVDAYLSRVVIDLPKATTHKECSYNSLEYFGIGLTRFSLDMTSAPPHEHLQLGFSVGFMVCYNAVGPEIAWSYKVDHSILCDDRLLEQSMIVAVKLTDSVLICLLFRVVDRENSHEVITRVSKPW